MVARLEYLFPGLRRSAYRVTSPADRDYNCIAWAVGHAGAWWWPVPVDDPDTHWPPGVDRVLSVTAFVQALATVGFAVCEGEDPEPDFEKVALFADADGLPTHAARQLPDGRWTSKLGRSEDIEHDLHALAGDIYGSVVLILKRPVPPTP
jgi:hypothetical protein